MTQKETIKVKFNLEPTIISTTQYLTDLADDYCLDPEEGNGGLKFTGSPDDIRDFSDYVQIVNEIDQSLPQITIRNENEFIDHGKYI